MSRFGRFGVIALVAALLGSGLAVMPPQAEPASAATGSEFDAGFIISDETFYNRAAMNAGQIQAFLADKGRSCSPNAYPCLKDFTLSWIARSGDAFCGTLPAGSGRASDYFVAVANACGINPQVLLVLVEKEQSLVSRTTPAERAYRFATGFACPDTPEGCSDATAGFATQVYLAAKQFQRYRINPGSYNYQAGRNNDILFHPDAAACGRSSVYIRNQATAGLYNYTPYQPNPAALANLYGTGDGCSSYGNRNFWRMFSDWFGSPANYLSTASFEASVARWGFSNGALDRQLAGPTTSAKSGQYFVAMYAHTPWRSLSQDVVTSISQRQVYTGSVWLRSGTPGVPFTGTLALWALGGTLEKASVPFTVGNDWTEVVVSLPIALSGHSAIRLEVYLQSTDAILHMDNTSLVRETGQQPRDPLTMSAPSFEGNVGTWTFKNGFMNRQIFSIGAEAKDGSWILAANTQYPGRSVGQDVAWSVAPGESYTATIWLRAPGRSTPFTGTFSLWAIGPGGAESSSAPISVGGEWTPVTTTITATRTATMLRVELYLDSVDGDVWLDAASLVPNLLPNPSFETSADGWNTGLVSGVVERVLGDPAIPATDGRRYGRTTTAFTSGSIATDVRRRTQVGETYEATVWVRSATPGDSWDGTLALWALGGAQEVATVAVSAGDEWTQVTLPLTLAQPGHDRLRLELYSGSPGEVLLFDGAALR
jgi:Carbohydrate binding domain.